MVRDRREFRTRTSSSRGHQRRSVSVVSPTSRGLIVSCSPLLARIARDSVRFNDPHGTGRHRMEFHRSWIDGARDHIRGVVNPPRHRGARIRDVRSEGSFFAVRRNEVNCAGLELRPCGGYVTRRSRRSSGYDSLLGNKLEGLEGGGIAPAASLAVELSLQYLPHKSGAPWITKLRPRK